MFKLNPEHLWVKWKECREGFPILVEEEIGAQTEMEVNMSHLKPWKNSCVVRVQTRRRWMVGGHRLVQWADYVGP